MSKCSQFATNLRLFSPKFANRRPRPVRFLVQLEFELEKVPPHLGADAELAVKWIGIRKPRMGLLENPHSLGRAGENTRILSIFTQVADFEKRNDWFLTLGCIAD